MRENNQYLQLASRLSLETDEGVRDIELYFGDITKLSQQDAVDAIMISAFPGDYSPTPGSVIGALKRELGIDVAKLSYNRAMDLRKLFHCWLSSELPADMPYRRLLCFERMHRVAKHPAEAVREVFRSLAPAFGDQEFSMITPLLATGDQNFSKLMMLEAIIDSAAFWIQAGLPMASFKIVIYTRDVTELSNENQRLLALFKLLKAKWEKRQRVKKAEVELKYDLYISASPSDYSKANEIVDLLKREKPDIRVCMQEVPKSLLGGELDSNEFGSWLLQCRDDIVASNRFVAILSPAYLESVQCLEQYNVALCTGLKQHRDMLAPFYISSVDLPTYMCMVQYIDCRGHKPEKMQHAIEQFLSSFDTGAMTLQPNRGSGKTSYDVFISYSHRNPEAANLLVDSLHLINSSLRVFIDRDSLHTGSAWQQTLYRSIDSSRVTIALCNNEYIASAVCQEEFSLALACHFKPDSEQEFIPILTDDVDLMPNHMEKLRWIHCSRGMQSVLLGVAKAIDGLVSYNDRADNVFMPHPTMVEWDSTMLIAERERLYNTELTEPVNRFINTLHENLNESGLDMRPEDSANQDVIRDRSNSLDPKSTTKRRMSRDERSFDLVISTHQKTLKYSEFLQCLLHIRAPHLKVAVLDRSSSNATEDNAALLGMLDSAKIVVPLLSRTYCSDPQSLEALHVALCLERSSQKTLVYPIQVTHLPDQPSYLALLHTRVACTDALWHDVLYESLSGTLPAHVLEATRLLKLQARENEQVVQALTTTQSLSLAVAVEDLLNLSSNHITRRDVPVLLNPLLLMNKRGVDLNKLSEEFHAVPAPTFNVNWIPEKPDAAEDPIHFQAQAVADYRANLPSTPRSHDPPRIKSADLEEPIEILVSQPATEGTVRSESKQPEESSEKPIAASKGPSEKRGHSKSCIIL